MLHRVGNVYSPINSESSTSDCTCHPYAFPSYYQPFEGYEEYDILTQTQDNHFDLVSSA